MKKRFLVTAAACALSAACIFGATACNNGSDDSGSGLPDVGASIEVANEAEWNAAFEKTLALTNYTAKVYVRDTYKDNGQLMGTEINESEAYIVGNEEYMITKFSGYETQKAYSLFEDEYSYNGYSAEYNEGTQNWEVRQYGLPRFANIIIRYEDRREYSLFNFENGVYIGTDGHAGTMTIKYKINAEGYVVYFSESYESEYEIYFSEAVFYNIGTTTYNFPTEAKQAVEDYKAANN